jgi:hypothetical protein
LNADRKFGEMTARTIAPTTIAASRPAHSALRMRCRA